MKNDKLLNLANEFLQSHYERRPFIQQTFSGPYSEKEARQLETSWFLDQMDEKEEKKLEKY